MKNTQIGADRGIVIGGLRAFHSGGRNDFGRLMSFLGCGLRLEEALKYVPDIHPLEVANVVRHAGFARRSDGQI